MSVSLSEAWNDPPPETFSPPPKVSARPSRVDLTDESAVSDNEPPETSSPAAPPSTDTVAVAFLEEIRQLRIEESRRCTVYLAVGGVLFALLFMYIDRLQQQIRSMNTILYHRQVPTVAAVTQGLMSTQVPRLPAW